MSITDRVYSGPWRLVLSSEAWEVLGENDRMFRERLDSTAWDDLAIAWLDLQDEKERPLVELEMMVHRRFFHVLRLTPRHALDVYAAKKQLANIWREEPLYVNHSWGCVLHAYCRDFLGVPYTCAVVLEDNGDVCTRSSLGLFRFSSLEAAGSNGENELVVRSCCVDEGALSLRPMNLSLGQTEMLFLTYTLLTAMRVAKVIGVDAALEYFYFCLSTLKQRVLETLRTGEDPDQINVPCRKGQVEIVREEGSRANVTQVSMI